MARIKKHSLLQQKNFVPKRLLLQENFYSNLLFL